MAVIFLAYYLFVLNPRNARSEKLSEIKSAYDMCVSNANAKYNSNFKNECRVRNLKEDCSLPLEIGDMLDANAKGKKDDCLQIYKTDVALYK